MGRCWPRWILLRGKLSIWKRIQFSLHFNPHYCVWSWKMQYWTFVVVLTSGANCIGWSCWYGKQRAICWYYFFTAFSNLPCTRQARRQHGTVCTPFCYVLSPSKKNLSVFRVMCWSVKWMCRCVICRVEFDEGESLVALPCKHPYHSECIHQWLQSNKVYNHHHNNTLPSRMRAVILQTLTFDHALMHRKWLGFEAWKIISAFSL
jgi:hypothetical protein